MHLRDDFDRMQQHNARTQLSRSPSASIPRGSPVGLIPSPYRAIHPGVIQSPHGFAIMGHHPQGGIITSPGTRQVGFSPVRFHPSSPYMLIPQLGAPLSASRKRPRDIDDHSVSPPVRRHKKRSSRSSDSSSSSSLGYSSSDQENSPTGNFGKPPPPPKYFPTGAEEFDDIDSSDSDYETDSDQSERVDDLRDFIDFDPKYNKSQISKCRKFSATGDRLRDFLFHDPAKPRKWFSAFAWNAVGAKLTRRKPSNFN
jgi:hypothetical protein